MLTLNNAFYVLKKNLLTLYNERESATIAHEVLEFITGLNKTKRLICKELLLNEGNFQQYAKITQELLTGKPLQYILETAWFLNRPFKVNDHVLIPRPETEELVMIAVNFLKERNLKASILDIGTGSGCIPITLKKLLPEADIWSCDISEYALELAHYNAIKHNSDIRLLQLDFLNNKEREQLPLFDLIISNPPYIPESQIATLAINVKDFEPEVALFVPDENPLVFYDAIAEFGITHLNENGLICCEIENSSGAACQYLFRKKGYQYVSILKDLHGNDRIITANNSI